MKIEFLHDFTLFVTDLHLNMLISLPFNTIWGLKTLGLTPHSDCVISRLTPLCPGMCGRCACCSTPSTRCTRAPQSRASSTSLSPLQHQPCHRVIFQVNLWCPSPCPIIDSNHSFLSSDSGLFRAADIANFQRQSQNIPARVELQVRASFTIFA